jgi:hypothetical protein
MSQQQSIYAPISFVSPISETTRPNPSSSVVPNTSLYTRISTYLSDAFTIEDQSQASRRESIISDHAGQKAEMVRRASIISTEDQHADKELQQWRRQSVDRFWARHGSLDGDGRRRSIVEGGNGNMWRGQSVGSGADEAKWRKMSWGVKDD